MTRNRFEYLLELENFSQPFITPDQSSDMSWRNPSVADQKILSELMLDSYRDTIDYDGETIEDAMHEVGSYVSGLEDTIWLDRSWLGFIENDLVCASLVGFWKDRNSPIISYVMTASQWKGKHLATFGVARSLQSLAKNNYTKVYAVITDGNVPSEKVFTRLGFERIAPIQ
jgi:RimJ/RimL family protein N-acetyltransferase